MCFASYSSSCLQRDVRLLDLVCHSFVLHGPGNEIKLDSHVELNLCYLRAQMDLVHLARKEWLAALLAYNLEKYRSKS
jgi:hypothetical protein